MSRQVLPSLLSLLFLLANSPSGCHAVVQFARVNGTITFTPAPAGSANVLLRNATAVSRFAWYTRDMFEDGIEARVNRNANPLFTSLPRILSLSVTGARNNPTSSSLAVSFTSALRITSTTRLTNGNYASSDITFAPYFTVRFLTRDYVDDLSDFVLPQIFDDTMRYSANIGNARVISDPRRPITRRLSSSTTTTAAGGGGADERNDAGYFLLEEDEEELLLEDEQEEEEESLKMKSLRGGV